MSADLEYRKLLKELLERGQRVYTRNSFVRRLFPWQVTFSSTPLITLRKTAWKNCLREWEWFMSGSDNIEDLHPAVRPWWEPWADKDCGIVYYNYSHQFREWNIDGPRYDQIEGLLRGIKGHPYSRRNVITTWNTAEMNDSLCPITNCHGTVVQAFCFEDVLSLVTYQRSVDVICGFPHNVFQYWAFLVWLASRTDNKVGTLTWIGGDVHLYDEHEGLARRILETEVQPAPGLVYSPSGEDFKADDFSLDGEYRYALEEKARMVV